MNWLIGSGEEVDPLFASVLWLHNVRSVTDSTFNTANGGGGFAATLGGGAFNPVGGFVSPAFLIDVNIQPNAPAPTHATVEFFSEIPDATRSLGYLAFPSITQKIEVTPVAVIVDWSAGGGGPAHGLVGGLNHFAVVTQTGDVFVNGALLTNLGVLAPIPVNNASTTIGYISAGVGNVARTFGPVRVTRGNRYPAPFVPPAWGPFPTRGP